MSYLLLFGVAEDCLWWWLNCLVIVICGCVVQRAQSIQLMYGQFEIDSQKVVVVVCILYSYLYPHML